MKGNFNQQTGFLPVMLGEAIEFPALDLPVIELGPAGLVALGGDLSPERLLAAYRGGIFPWSVQPITWWSPHKRGIIEFGKFHVSRSLERLLRKQPFELTLNKAFTQVMNACAETHRADGNWISEDFIKAYSELHLLGNAHSIECWQEDRLVGGIYGVAIGGMFSAESMFYHVSNASKVALVALVRSLALSGFTLLDVQMVTPTTAAFGASEVKRSQYLDRLEEALKETASLKLAAGFL